MITIWYSEMKFLSFESFHDLGNLEFINIQDNVIEELPENIFEKTGKLKTLNIGGNKIKVLPEKLLWNNQGLTIFIASRNKIEFLPKQLFKNNQKLELINLNNNFLKVIEVEFKQLSNIKKIFGFQNNCTDFSLSNKTQAVELDKMLKQKCSKKDETIKKNQ